MGMCIGFSKSSADTKFVEKLLPNPNPKRCVILKSYQFGCMLILQIKYIDSTNFEGIKLLVFKDVALANLEKQLLIFGIDPHFSDNAKIISPIARFVPTREGLEMAINFCKLYE